MIIYPAIDLRGGRCVRLLEGDFARETVYGDDPVAMAGRWVADGATWLHVVDLDGARAGHPVQLDIVERICAAAGVPVQVGGGVRTQDDVARVLAAGAGRVVMGTVAVRDPGLFADACARHPGQVALGLDARDGRVRVAGWLEGEAVVAVDLAARARELGAATVIFTDIGRDGTGHGPDIDGTRAVARVAGVPVIASGGVGRLEDVAAVARLVSDGVDGVIIGRALYTGAVDLSAALALARDGA